LAPLWTVAETPGLVLVVVLVVLVVLVISSLSCSALSRSNHPPLRLYLVAANRRTHHYLLSKAIRASARI
jgi:Tfp pilus assembly protein PilX